MCKLIEKAIYTCCVVIKKSGVLSPLNRFVALLVLSICMSTFSQENKPVIGVLGLENQGGLTESVVDSICNRISELIDQSQKYLVFQREFIPPTLEAQGFKLSGMICSQKEGLAAAGNLLAADQIVGGTVKRENNVLTLEVQRITVIDRQLLCTEKIVSTGSKQDVLNVELPEMVTRLLTDTPVQNIPIKKDVTIAKKRNKTPLLVILGTLTAGGIAAGVYAIYESINKADSEPDVPLDELPQRKR